MDIERILEKYGTTIYNIAYYYAKNKYDADDILQNVCLKLYKRQAVFKDENHERAYIIRAAINNSKSFVRSAWFKKVIFSDREVLQYDTIEIKEEKELYYKLEKLPPKYRTVIHLFYYEDMSIEEIAKTLNKSKSAVKTQLHRARKLLKEYFEEDENV